MSEAQPAASVLVVDDDDHIAAALCIRLKHEGYTVQVAKDAVTAVSVARKFGPDVVLLDINMPGGTGFDVAKRLDRCGSGIPKIFITASKKPGLREAAARANASGFVEKPFTAAELVCEIENALTRARSVMPQTFR